MNLIIEQGNTATKLAIFDKGHLEKSFVYDILNVQTLIHFFDTYSVSESILSTVIESDPEIISFLRERCREVIFLNESTSLPVKIQYQTPHTLGMDRLAAVVGANYLQPGKDILVIDAGTAITYELLEASGIYVGGNISPGMNTRFKSLNLFTKKLPLIKEAEEIPLTGTTTETAIRAGVIYGICYEMDGYINELRVKYPNLFIFLTGGHSNYFAGRLKNRIFANINLVLVGLNRILEYNVENKESSSSQPFCHHTDGNACTKQH
ncbi:MAG: type III pantothenate kinase [Tannerella sp.]|nr:type III pantothenate kinase [Tannerella sp.]